MGQPAPLVPELLNPGAVSRADSMVSVVVPVYNEADSVGPLIDRTRSALTALPAWELVIVDDGSDDATAHLVAEAATEDPRVRLVRLARNFGQTAALQAGFDRSHGDVVVSMDGDLQNDPADIPALVATLEEGYDLVAGYRVRRQDRLFRRKIPSWIANRMIAAITGVSIRDNGCSLKAYRRALLDRLYLYSDMHRFIPGLAVATAGARIAERPVRHHPRRFGVSKYGLNRIAKVLADLLTLVMIRSFRERPLRLFVYLSVTCGLIGALFAGLSLFAFDGTSSDSMTAFVLPGTALLWFGTAGFMIMLGLVSEVALWQERSVAVAVTKLATLRSGVRGRGP